MTEKLVFIADPGCNWTGDLLLLKRIAHEIKKTETEDSVIYLKPQLFQAELLYAEKDNPYYQLQQKCSMTFEQAEEIFYYCKDIGLNIIFSPFDLERIQWCQEFKVHFIKVANRMSTDLEFLNAVKETDIPPIISISKNNRLPFYNYDNLFGKNRYKLMFTSQKYPSSIIDYPLKQVNMCGGLSNHIPNIYLDIAATAIGCQVFEHHIYLSWQDTPDINSSISTVQFQSLVKTCNEINEIRT